MPSRPVISQPKPPFSLRPHKRVVPYAVCHVEIPAFSGGIKELICQHEGIDDTARLGVTGAEEVIYVGIVDRHAVIHKVREELFGKVKKRSVPGNAVNAHHAAHTGQSCVGLKPGIHIVHPAEPVKKCRDKLTDLRVQRLLGYHFPRLTESVKAHENAPRVGGKPPLAEGAGGVSDDSPVGGGLAVCGGAGIVLKMRKYREIELSYYPLYGVEVFFLTGNAAVFHECPHKPVLSRVHLLVYVGEVQPVALLAPIPLVVEKGVYPVDKLLKKCRIGAESLLIEDKRKHCAPLPVTGPAGTAALPDSGSARTVYPVVQPGEVFYHPAPKLAFGFYVSDIGIFHCLIPSFRASRLFPLRH